MEQRAKQRRAVRGEIAVSVSAPFHLVLLFEAVALGGFHLVDVLEEVGHAHGGVQLPRVVGRAFASTLVPWGASQQAAGLVHQATAITCDGDTHGKEVKGQALHLQPFTVG